MKRVLIGTMFVMSIFISGAAAIEDTGSTAMEAVKPVEVGNKICPVSGEKVGEMGEVVKIEHEGKVYNLCCTMCQKDFKKDPQKYIDKVNEELKASTAEQK